MRTKSQSNMQAAKDDKFSEGECIELGTRTTGAE